MYAGLLIDWVYTSLDVFFRKVAEYLYSIIDTTTIRINPIQTYIFVIH